MNPVKFLIIMTGIVAALIHTAPVMADEWLEIRAANARQSILLNLIQKKMWFADRLETHEGYPFSRFENNEDRLLIEVENDYKAELLNRHKSVKQKMIFNLSGSHGVLVIEISGVFLTNPLRIPVDVISGNNP